MISNPVRTILLAATVLLLAAGSRGYAQGTFPRPGADGPLNSPTPTAESSGGALGSTVRMGDPIALPSDVATQQRLAPQRARDLVADRQKKMTSDAERMAVLATEIKAELAKTSKDQLSVVVLKKAAELEKLAHDLRTRMTN